MKPSQTPDIGASYLNPVHNRMCPDPFMLKFGGEYWCYCTGLWHDGRAFGVMHSRDLVSWRELSGAMEAVPGDGATCYWAPEVTYDNGRFFMYYSVGDGVRMEMRVAVAEHPAGPFVDSGRRLTAEEFAIDGHVVVDTGGARYLFYATDFLEHTHVGTGTVRDRLIDPYTLAGDPQPVTRALYDWQVYDPARREKGGVRWHTVEGPFVLRRKGKYYQMFSGGNWQNISYGVSYATSERLDAAQEWEQASDGERVLPILRTIPGRVTGPGHNSVVRAPDNQELFCVYHVWAEDASARVLAIDRLDWVGERMTVLGPSTTRMHAPHAPTFADFFDDEGARGLGDGWECRGGRWSSGGGEASQEDGAVARAEAFCRTESARFVLEVTLRALSEGVEGSAFGVGLESGERACIFEFSIVPQTGRAVILWQGEQGGKTTWLALPGEFNPKAFHLLRIEADAEQVNVSLDEGQVYWHGRLAASPARASLLTRHTTASFKGFALTAGWQNLFEDEARDTAAHGWQPESGDWSVEAGRLSCAAKDDETALVVKDAPTGSYELVVNVRLEGETLKASSARYGFYPAFISQGRGLWLWIGRAENGLWMMEVLRDGAVEHVFQLNDSFDPFVYQQFRLTRQAEQLRVQWEGVELGVVALATGEETRRNARVGLFVARASGAFDMVRVTSLAGNS